MRAPMKHLAVLDGGGDMVHLCGERWTAVTVATSRPKMATCPMCLRVYGRRWRRLVRVRVPELGGVWLRLPASDRGVEPSKRRRAP